MRNNQRSRPPLQRMLIAAAPVALAVGLAACSSSGSSSSSSAGASSQATTASSPGLKQAEAVVSADTSAPTSIGITQPVGKPIPTGKHIVLVYSGQGAIGTELAYTPFKAAAKVLGWNVTSIYPALPTPQDLQQAMNIVVPELLPPSGRQTAAPPERLNGKREPARADIST